MVRTAITSRRSSGPLFEDRLYFKFNPERFFPNSEEQVERLSAQRNEEARRQRIIENGGDWLIRFISRAVPAAADDAPPPEVLDVLKSYYLFEKDSPDQSLARGMLERAGLGEPEALFPILVKLGVFEENENIQLLRLGAPVEFSPAVLQQSRALIAASAARAADSRREDLTGLALITIDGQSTLDFDDALSLETTSDGYRLGVHISDVAHYVRKDDPIDRRPANGAAPSTWRTTNSACRRLPGRGALQPEGGGSPAGHQHLGGPRPRHGHPGLPHSAQPGAGPKPVELL